MGAVAIGANGSLLRAGGDSISVNALLVGRHHLGALAAIGHDELLAVAGAASGGDIGVMHPRFRIGGGKQFVWTSMTIHASGGFAVASLNGLAVKAAFVGSLLVRVAQ